MNKIDFKVYQGIESSRKYYVTERNYIIWEDVDAMKALAKKLHVDSNKIHIQNGYVLEDHLYLERPNKNAKEVNVLTVKRS